MGTKRIPLCTNDVYSIVKTKTKLKEIELPKAMKFEVLLEVDEKLMKLIDGDQKLAGDIFSQVSKSYNAAIKKIVNRCDFAESSCKQKPGNRPVIAKQLKKDIEGYLQDAGKEICSYAEKKINAMLKTRKDNTKYKIKSAIKITVGTLAIGGSVATTALTFGASSAVSIYGIAKGVSTIGQEIYTLAISFDKAHDSLNKHLGELLASYSKLSKGKIGARETGQALLEQLFTVSGTSITSVKKDFKTYEYHLDRIDVKCRDYGIGLVKILDAQSDINKNVALKAEKEIAKRGYKSKRLPKLKTQLATLEKKTGLMITKNEKAIQRVKTNRKYSKVYAQVLQDLKAKKPTWAKVAEKGIALLDVPLSAATTDFSNATQIAALTQDIAQLVGEKLIDEF